MVLFYLHNWCHVYTHSTVHLCPAQGLEDNIYIRLIAQIFVLAAQF